MVSTRIEPFSGGGSGRLSSLAEFGTFGRIVIARNDRPRSLKQPPGRMTRQRGKGSVQPTLLPAKAGPSSGPWIPACAGMSGEALRLPQHQIVPVHHFGAPFDAEDQ